MKKQKNLKNVAYYCVLLLLVLVMLYSGLRILESTVLLPTGEAVPTATKTIVRDGVEYFPRQDVTVVMVLGIDQSGPVEASPYHRNDGSADSIMLLIFDEAAENCTVLYLNRDTMVNMDVLGLKGENAGTAYGQLALSHTYGTGLDDSCENVKNTLMRFLPGLTIDYYVAMNMDAIPVLNDAVGGVTVNVVDDFSQVNSSIPMGEVTLRGDQVIDFVRTRKGVGDQKNVSRIERQKEYVNGFMEALQRKSGEDLSFVLDTYQQLSPYIVTDCSVDTLNNLLSRFRDYAITRVVSPEGENQVVDGYYQFHVDEQKLDVLVVDLFYRPKK